ncbi:MAG: hypothetical protein AAF434_03865 [Pseudomonadota bacterium]
MIVIATCDDWPEINPGLLLIVEALEAKGKEVRCLPWQSSNLELFCAAELVLPLCAWDYAKSPAAFISWISAIRNGGGRLINSPDILLGNLNKRYLIDLYEAGFNVIPSHYVGVPSLSQILAIQDTEGWTDSVVKPVYGQSGYQVELLSRIMERDESTFDCDSALLVQPFIQEIKSRGELSVYFIAGEFSHAVCRKPARGEWRANTRFNASVTQVAVDQNLIEQAAKFLEFVTKVPLYVRVDGIVKRGSFVLSELEMVEPALFFDHIEDLTSTQFFQFIEILSA